MDSNAVSTELELRCLIPPHTIVPLAASLFYSRQDPYAIRIAFHVGQNEPVEWTCARDLLSMGMAGREGIGDVRVWPSAGSAGGAPGSALNIRLWSPSGQAQFEASARDISDFIRRTYQLVPAGQETSHLDLDSELEDLLRQET